MKASDVRKAVDQAVRDFGKPLADLTPDEAAEVHRRALALLMIQGFQRRV